MLPDLCDIHCALSRQKGYADPVVMPSSDKMPFQQTLAMQCYLFLEQLCRKMQPAVISHGNRAKPVPAVKFPRDEDKGITSPLHLGSQRGVK